MSSLILFVRRLTTFLLASFLWIHALFFWNVQTSLVAGLSRYMHLTLSEVTLFILLFLFSILCSSGWWGAVKSAGYIYLFPFVLLFYFFVLVFLALKRINAWFSKDQPSVAGPSLSELVVLPTQPPSAKIVMAQPSAPAPKKTPSLFSVVTRPFRHFTLLWCALLLFATHKPVLWLSLAVVLGVLALRIATIVNMTLFSRSWLERIGAAFYIRLNTMLSMLATVSPKTVVSKELKDLWQQLGLWEKVARFLSNKYLLSWWASFLVGAFYICLYFYIALLFSFVYVGIARVSELNLTWPEAVVNSVFILRYVTEFPKTLLMRLVGGAQWTIIVVVGFGTFWNYLHKRLEAVHTGALEISGVLADEEVRARYKLLESKVKPAKDASASQSQNSGKKKGKMKSRKRGKQS